MFKKSIKESLFIFCSGLLLAACGKLIDESQPRVVVHHFPQKISRGALQWDCPVFVAYADGTIIWRRAWASSVAAFALTTSRNAERKTQKLEALITNYGGKTFTLTNSSDPEITRVWSAGKTLTIRGDWRKPRMFEAGSPSNALEIALANEREKELWSALPLDVRDALAEVAALDEADGKSWQPKELNLTLMPAGEMLGDAVPWPSQWPQTFTAVPGSREMKQIKLPGSMLDDLMSVVARDGQPRALIVAGERKYADVRFIFPGEAAWKKIGNARKE